MNNYLAFLGDKSHIESMIKPKHVGKPIDHNSQLKRHYLAYDECGGICRIYCRDNGELIHTTFAEGCLFFELDRSLFMLRYSLDHFSLCYLSPEQDMNNFCLLSRRLSSNREANNKPLLYRIKGMIIITDRAESFLGIIGKRGLIHYMDNISGAIFTRLDHIVIGNENGEGFNIYDLYSRKWRGGYAGTPLGWISKRKFAAIGQNGMIYVYSMTRAQKHCFICYGTIYEGPHKDQDSYRLRPCMNTFHFDCLRKMGHDIDYNVAKMCPCGSRVESIELLD